MEDEREAIRGKHVVRGGENKKIKGDKIVGGTAD